MTGSRVSQLYRRCAEWVPVAPPRTSSDADAAVELLDRAAVLDPHRATFAAEAMVEELEGNAAMKLLHAAAERVDDDELRLAMYREGLNALAGNRANPADLARELLGHRRCDERPWDAAAAGAVLLAAVDAPSARLALAGASTRLERDGPPLKMFRLALSQETATSRQELARLAQEMVNTTFPNRLHAIWVAAGLVESQEWDEAAKRLALAAADGSQELGSLAVYQSLLLELAEPGKPDLTRLAYRVVENLPADCGVVDAASTCSRLLRALDPQLAPVAETLRQAGSLDQVKAHALAALKIRREHQEQEVWRLAEGLHGKASRIRRGQHQVWVGGVPLPVRWTD